MRTLTSFRVVARAEFWLHLPSSSLDIYSTRDWHHDTPMANRRFVCLLNANEGVRARGNSLDSTMGIERSFIDGS